MSPVRCSIPLKLSVPFSPVHWLSGGPHPPETSTGVSVFWGTDRRCRKSSVKTLSRGPLYRRMHLGFQALTKGANKGWASLLLLGEHVSPPALTHLHTPKLKFLPCPNRRCDPRQVTQLPEPSSFSALREGDTHTTHFTRCNSALAWCFNALTGGESLMNC